MRKLAVLLALLLLPLQAQAAPIALELGWVVAHWGFVPTVRYSIGGPAIDGAGNVYVCGSEAIYKFAPANAQRTKWSDAVGYNPAMLPTGEAWLCTGDGDPTLYARHVLPDGSFTDIGGNSLGNGFTFAAIGPGGNPYFNIWAEGAFPDQGLYTMDRVTNEVTLLHDGGPFADGHGFYAGMTVLADDTLYTFGSDYDTVGVFKWTGSNWAFVAPTPNTVLWSLSPGPGGTILGAGDKNVYRIDPLAGTATLIATNFGNVDGVVYDAVRDRIYVIDQVGSQVWLVNHESIPAKPTSWGAIKDRYR
jgi:hypothetical protein